MVAAKQFRIGKRESGGALRRFKTPRPNGARITLHPDHPASKHGGTLFPSRIRHASAVDRVLKSGANASKIGKVVLKGKWRGFPIFTLTLEERATCPQTCKEWASCYGNNMHMAQRIRHDEEFELKLWQELQYLNSAFPGGFVVRLHVLGDFYSVEYVELWERALAKFSGLHVFGYTARDAFEPIGMAIFDLASEQRHRFAIRFSGCDAQNFGAVVIDKAEDTKHLICPAQLGKTDCCATCALCWQSDRTIAFLRH